MLRYGRVVRVLARAFRHFKDDRRAETAARRPEQKGRRRRPRGRHLVPASGEGLHRLGRASSGGPAQISPCRWRCMNLAYVSLTALVIAIVVSCFTEVNVGVLALAFAWIVGVYFGGMRLDAVIGGFPISLFLTLAGVTLLFAQAQLNGTLDR